MIRFSQFFTISFLAFLWSFAPSIAQKRVALVIGNSAYLNASTLLNPTNDADEMALKLSHIGFEVRKIKNVGYNKMRLALRQFSSKAARADVSLIFYAGHGMEVNKQNYIIPTDARLASDRDIDFEAVPLELLTQAAGGAGELSLVLLDACRNNPFAASMKRTIGTRSIGRGLARVEPTAGTLVSFAAKEGTVANDGDGKNSPYTTALMKYLSEPGLEVQFLFRKVRDAVLRETHGSQEPFTYGSLPGRQIYLVNLNKGIERSDNQSSTSEQQLFWASIHESGDITSLQLYLKKYPNGIFAELAKLKIVNFRNEREKTNLALQQSSKEDHTTKFEKLKTVTRETTKNIQRELNRLGCDAGRPDGIWGQASRRALMRYGRYGHIKLASMDPSETLLDQLRAVQPLICPLVCRSGYEKKAQKCVQIKREASIQKPEQIKKSSTERATSRNKSKSKRKTASKNAKKRWKCKYDFDSSIKVVVMTENERWRRGSAYSWCKEL